MEFRNLIRCFIVLASVIGCKNSTEPNRIVRQFTSLQFSEEILDFRITPKDSLDRSGLMFSDQGAWFAFGLPESQFDPVGFTGPFLMTQQNGIWVAPSLVKLEVSGVSSEGDRINWKGNLVSQKSYASHLEQTYDGDSLKIEQHLTFMSGNTALQRTRITNKSTSVMALETGFSGKLFQVGATISKEEKGIVISSRHSSALGHIQIVGDIGDILVRDSISYRIGNPIYHLNPSESKEYLVSQTFIFPEHSWAKEGNAILNVNFDSVLQARKMEKENQLASLINQSKQRFSERKYGEVLAKAHLTLQNNWRVAAGELKHQGLFPSYHYEWFHGFWSWDSWKHASGLSRFNSNLAKDQIRAMFDYQAEDGFILDCIYRDTTIENHNYRDTKPPLAAWAVLEIMKRDKDHTFLEEVYLKLLKYHNWWYEKRDHDQDGLCEYGSTDGTVLAAKWESGMDNAIRFDSSNILKNSDGAYSLDQESVDLNSYLYAEKLHLAQLGEILGKNEEAYELRSDAAKLKKMIQDQFFDTEDRWFYDTNLEGSQFIKGAGCEGWTALWAKAATKEQAESVKSKMMDNKKFYTKVPFQTMSKDHPKFDPLNGYWRGPNWLDQAYFGIMGLRNYGYNLEADNATIQIVEGAQGLLEKGKSIRENYHPITGEGREAENFSWSAAHIILMLTED